MSKKYYTLCERTPGQLFSPQFGDYSKGVVIQERADMKDSGSFIKGTEFAIICTSGTQDAIMTACDDLNTPAVRAKAKVEQDRVIVRKAPNAQVRRNLEKLERRPVKAQAETDASAIKAIYKSEGADACLGLCKHFKQTKRGMLMLLASFEAE